MRASSRRIRAYVVQGQRRCVYGMRLHSALVGFCRAGAVWLAMLAMPDGVAAPSDVSGIAPAPPYKAPYTPMRDDAPLQEVPSASDPAVRQMRLLRGELDTAGSSLVIAEQLAQAYIDFGRQVGDAHYAGYAEAVLAPWLQRPSPPATVLVEYATILQYRHQFLEARRELKRALISDPHNTQAWLTLATVDMVQGDYDAASHDCSQVAANGGYLLVIACTGNLRSYIGQAQQSLSLLTQIDGQAQTLPPAFRSWVQGLLAETSERLGDCAQAETYYRKALSLTPEDNFLLVAYADFLLDRHRPAEVLTLLSKASQSDTAFLRVALAKAALRSPDLPLYTWIMAARFAALAQRGSDYFGREQVRFALYLQHDPQAALKIAERNWEVQRAPWDARVFLESAQAARQPQAAAPALAFLRKTNLQDPIIEPLARRIEAELGSPAVAP
jgi:tetratricopeptide (TPR) repeat protein